MKSKIILFVSVVIPFISFNQQLKRTIFSLLNSINLDREKPIEVILVCNSQKFDYLKYSSYIKNFHSNHFFFTLKKYDEVKGPSPSWCYGAKIAKAPYVLFLSADTYIDKLYLSKFINIFNHKIPFYLGNYCGNQSQKDIPYLESLIDRDRFVNKQNIDFRAFGF